MENSVLPADFNEPDPGFEDEQQPTVHAYGVTKQLVLNRLSKIPEADRLKFVRNSSLTGYGLLNGKKITTMNDLITVLNLGTVFNVVEFKTGTLVLFEVLASNVRLHTGELPYSTMLQEAIELDILKGGSAVEPNKFTPKVGENVARLEDSVRLLTLNRPDDTGAANYVTVLRCNTIAPKRTQILSIAMVEKKGVKTYFWQPGEFPWALPADKLRDTVVLFPKGE